MSRASWPASWGRDFESLASLQRFQVRAEGEEVVLFGNDLRPFARVPVGIELAVLSRVVPLLRASYDAGVEHGRKQLSGELRQLLGIPGQ